ncbi:hypothetical protein [Motilimonas pumila]|uniref:hypothetical protein n=1 Tax=Motilimonas pumila TaxID=2303987 RepID=UPI001313DECD|nr:hypothetical protein [Motilimonas pumila]
MKRIVLAQVFLVFAGNLLRFHKGIGDINQLGIVRLSDMIKSTPDVPAQGVLSE